MSRYLSKLRCLKGGWVTFNENVRGKGRPPPTNFGLRKLESLGYRMVKKIAENFNRLSRAHQRHRQTDRQTTDDRRQTDLRWHIANVNASSRPLKMENAWQEIEPQAKKMGIVQLYRRAQNEDRLY